MTKIYQYPQKIAIITDDLSHATKVAKEMAHSVYIEVFNWAKFKQANLRDFDIPVFDVDIGVVKNVNRLKKIQNKNKKREDTIFSIDRGNFGLVTQANAIGVQNDVKRPLSSEELTQVVVRLCNKKATPNAARYDEVVATKKSADACLAVSDLMDGLMLAVRKGTQLPVEEMQASSSHIIDAIDNANMDTWLKAVRSHSSFTYRHVMIVSGFAAAFGRAYNLSHAEKERLTMGALLHDIGKVKIPQKILDKPGKLDPAELERMRRHSKDGADILRSDKRVNEEIISIALCHHEYLDGSGYPDGLKADEIPDIVRLITVIDIFSALVEARSYKASMSHQDAYNILLEMGDKLDQDIVRAFEPIALDKQSHELVKRINGAAA